MKRRILGQKPLRGMIRIPADKSMTHRALLFSALAEGTSIITADNPGEDNKSTAACLRQLGVRIEETSTGFVVHGMGTTNLKNPENFLDCGNSGTTTRLLCGILAGANVQAILKGDDSLAQRPMTRVTEPLRLLGANIQGLFKNGKEYPPISVDKGNFQGGFAKLNIASAQLKSALLLAGVTSGKAVQVWEPALSRDHTERMLKSMGASIQTYEENGGFVACIDAHTQLTAQNFHIPGDISSASFWIAAAILTPDSDLILENVGLNPTRTGFLDVVMSLGAQIDVIDPCIVAGEPVASLRVRSGLHANTSYEPITHISGALIPRLIDELVVLGAVFSQYPGNIFVHDAQELKVKESDRIIETVRLLQHFGITAIPYEDGFSVKGPQALCAASVDVSCDHRIALTGAILALAAPGVSELNGAEIATVSYPGFYDIIDRLQH